MPYRYKSILSPRFGQQGWRFITNGSLLEDATTHFASTCGRCSADRCVRSASMPGSAAPTGMEPSAEAAASSATRKATAPAAAPPGAPRIAEQIGEAAERFRSRSGTEQFLAYFQPGSNTYGPPGRLRAALQEALQQPGVVGIFVGTRPDCLAEGAMDIEAEFMRRDTRQGAHCLQ